MPSEHRYRTALEWTGNRGVGTRRYDAYARDHVVRVAGKPELLGSSDPTYRGDASRWNPEELLVASLAGCHMLWYLHLAAVHGVEVVAYTDAAEGTLVLSADGGGRFSEVVLHPRVTIAAGSPATAHALHDDAHRRCFIAASVNFPVRHDAEIRSVGAGDGAGRPA